MSPARVLPPGTPIQTVTFRTEPDPPPASVPAEPEDGYPAGFRDGQAAGEKAAVERAQTLLQDLEAVLADARDTVREVGRRAGLARDSAVQEGAMALADAVLARLWEEAADVRHSTLRRLLEELPPDTPATLSVAPGSREEWTETAAALLGEAADRLRWRTDPGLRWGDLEARWAGGGWWGGLRAALWALSHPEEAPPL